METITKATDNQNTELWSPDPTDTSTTQLLYLRFGSDRRGRGRLHESEDKEDGWEIVFPRNMRSCIYEVSATWLPTHDWNKHSKID